MSRTLDYASPPPRRADRPPGLVVVARGFALLSIVFYLITLMIEPGLWAAVKGYNDGEWTRNELQRRFHERDRRAGALVPPAPMAFEPIRPYPGVKITLMLGRLTSLVWACMLAAEVGRVAAISTTSAAAAALRPYCEAKLFLAVPLLALDLHAHVRSIYEAGVWGAAWMLAIDLLGIALAGVTLWWIVNRTTNYE